MNPKDAIDIAYKNAEFAAKSLQVFAVASAAIGGWIVATDYVRATEALSWARVTWVALYLCIAIYSWAVNNLALERANACLLLARDLADEDLAKNDSFLNATKRTSNFGGYFGIPVIVLVVSGMILFSP